MRGSGSSSSSSNSRSPPISVCNITWEIVPFSRPMIAAASPPGKVRQMSNARGASSADQHCDHAALAGKIKRIIAQHIADRANRRVDRNGSFLQMHRHFSHARDIVHHRDKSAASWISHEAQARQVPQRLCQRKDTGRIGGQIAPQTEILACEQHCRPMVANRAAHHHRVAATDLIEAKPKPGRRTPIPVVAR